MEKVITDEKRMMDALVRSGYLLESKVASIFADKDFFVESNQVIFDQGTGKSREIDFVAESMVYIGRVGKIGTLQIIIRCIVEVKNNVAPLVLINELDDLNRFMNSEALKVESYCPDKHIYTGMSNPFYERLIMSKALNIYTQYCSFQEKKTIKKRDDGKGHVEGQELMAHHPEALHEGLKKITQVCEEFITSSIITPPKKKQKDRSVPVDRVARINIPIVVLADDLFELRVNSEKENTLVRVSSSMLLHNYHYNGQAKSSFVYILTERELEKFLDDLIADRKKIFNISKKRLLTDLQM